MASLTSSLFFVRDGSSRGICPAAVSESFSIRGNTKLLTGMASGTTPSVVMMATPKKGIEQRKQRIEEITEKIVKAIGEAEEICKGNENSVECVLKWEEVEELSTARAHKKMHLRASD
ncbi:hypothetical protein R1flu_018464 [Riccia fluitans]|uniref:Uncharacterized protein n=1 Tax=Riccia fluitans TaxID=41844 RepID=A0ABD1ZHD9_9MARC